MNFIDAIKSAFSNYANFQGRALRSEYWWFWLFNFLLNFAYNIVAEMDVMGLVGSIVAIVIGLAILLPHLAVSVRRMHDVERSGWWLLLLFTVIGVIPVLYWLIIKGTDGPNRFGEDRLTALATAGTQSPVA